MDRHEIPQRIHDFIDCFSSETTQHRLWRGQLDPSVGWITSQIGPDICNLTGVLLSPDTGHIFNLTSTDESTSHSLAETRARLQILEVLSDSRAIAARQRVHVYQITTTSCISHCWIDNWWLLLSFRDVWCHPAVIIDSGKSNIDRFTQTRCWRLQYLIAGQTNGWIWANVSCRVTPIWTTTYSTQTNITTNRDGRETNDNSDSLPLLFFDSVLVIDWCHSGNSHKGKVGSLLWFRELKWSHSEPGKLKKGFRVHS